MRRLGDKVVKKPSQRQLSNLAKGREINFQNQLRRKGIPQTIIKREIIQQQPIMNNNITHQHFHQIKLSLFKELIGAKIFPIEINGKKENYDLQKAVQIINYRMDNYHNRTASNEKKLNEIISHLNNKDKENEERFKKIERKIFELEKENKNLKEVIKEFSEGKDDATKTK